MLLAYIFARWSSDKAWMLALLHISVFVTSVLLRIIVLQSTTATPLSELLLPISFAALAIYTIDFGLVSKKCSTFFRSMWKPILLWLALVALFFICFAFLDVSGAQKAIAMTLFAILSLFATVEWSLPNRFGSTYSEYSMLCSAINIANPMAFLFDRVNYYNKDNILRRESGRDS